MHALFYDFLFTADLGDVSSRWMPERIPNLAEFDDISPIVGKNVAAAAFMIDWDLGRRRRRRGAGQRR